MLPRLTHASRGVFSAEAEERLKALARVEVGAAFAADLIAFASPTTGTKPQSVAFSSVIFLFYFLPGTLAVAVALQALVNRFPGRRLWLRLSTGWLFAASLAFYCWGEPRLFWVMLLSAVLNYAGGLVLDGLGGAGRRRAAIVALVAANLGLLVYFKYAGLAGSALDWASDRSGASSFAASWSDIALPLGISFFTFHGLSYVVDVYRGAIRATRHPIDFGCYFTFFPQLVAGPITRFSEVGRYFESRRVSLDDLAGGARRFIVGLGKKVLIANQVALLADAAFALEPGAQTAGTAWLGALAYALQLYFDFSGYTDMALGLGRMLGFTFPENFNQPYAATSIRDFWRRWHMTLSRFFRDYLYIPLGGNRAAPWRVYFNLLAVFALCGLWHGASWTFLLWGLYHGLFLSLERAFGPREEATAPPPRARWWSHVYALGVVLFGWVLFRAETWQQCLHLWGQMVSPASLLRIESLPWRSLAPDVLLALLAGVLLCIPPSAWRLRRPLPVDPPAPVRLAADLGHLALLALSLIAVGAGSHNPFIYFRF